MELYNRFVQLFSPDCSPALKQLLCKGTMQADQPLPPLLTSPSTSALIYSHPF